MMTCSFVVSHNHILKYWYLQSSSLLTSSDFESSEQYLIMYVLIKQ